MYPDYRHKNKKRRFGEAATNDDDSAFDVSQNNAGKNKK
jgi:hypothetical protein